VRDRLQALGFEARIRGAGAPTPEELREASLVLISSTAWSFDVNTQYRDVALPVISWEPSLFDDMGMTGPEESGECDAVKATGEAIIKDPSHPLAAGLAGTVQLVSRAPMAHNGRGRQKLMMTYGVPGPHAAWIATWPGEPTHALVFAYERGAPMPGLAAAPGRRVGLFLWNDTPTTLTDAGWSLFDAAVAWSTQDRPRD
jgi:hypothetical protein